MLTRSRYARELAGREGPARPVVAGCEATQRYLESTWRATAALKQHGPLTSLFSLVSSALPPFDV